MTDLRLVVDVGYDGDAFEGELASLLHGVVADAFGNGQFTGDLDVSAVYVESRVLVRVDENVWQSIGVPTIMSSEGDEQ